MANPEWLRAAITLGNQFHYGKQRPLLPNAINLGVMTALVGLTVAILGAAASVPAALYIPVGGFLLGVAFFALIILVIHEASHGMFLISRDRARARSWNRAFGWAVAVPFAINYARHWEEGHHAHHLRPMEPAQYGR
jgi:fatty acid desaturase